MMFDLVVDGLEVSLRRIKKNYGGQRHSRNYQAPVSCLHGSGRHAVNLSG
jgi:hypothetical protein